MLRKLIKNSKAKGRLFSHGKFWRFGKVKKINHGLEVDRMAVFLPKIKHHSKSLLSSAPNYPAP